LTILNPCVDIATVSFPTIVELEPYELYYLWE
jgi:hypothetical protein